MMRKIAIILSYDGTNYHGWQMQANSVSVQGVLTSAASSLFNEEIKITGCGRTDSGVHAKMYVASFDTSSEIPLDRIAYGLNSMLPPDISVKCAFVVDDEFHPVHSCIEKEYTYYIYTDTVRDPFLEKRALHYRYPFDPERVRAAAAHFVGTHDFSSYMAQGSPVESTVRTIFYTDVVKNGDIVTFKVAGDGFLYNMVRIMTGTLVSVAKGSIEPDDITEITESLDRTRAGMTAPPEGLYLNYVEY